MIDNIYCNGTADINKNSILVKFDSPNDFIDVISFYLIGADIQLPKSNISDPVIAIIIT